MQTQEVVHQIPPSEILADDNIRFGLKQSRIDSLASDITDKGEVMVPLEVNPLPEPKDGKKYRVEKGHYRLAALEKLNKDGAGMLAPCLIRDAPETRLARLDRQLAENNERENLSPMDCAVLIDEYLKAGLPKVEIRNKFQRSGGRKGNKVQPMSNALLNMYHSFLDFPKPIQTKIHLGESGGGIGVATAYELHKKPRDKWQAILDVAEADRVKSLEQEEADETKYLQALDKEKEAEEKLKKDAEALEAAKKLQDNAISTMKERTEIATEAYKAAMDAKTKDADTKKKADEAFKAAEDAAKAAEKAAAEAAKTVERMQEKTKKAAEAAAARAKLLKDSRKQKDATPANKAKGVGQRDIQKAASKLDANNGRVQLNASEMRRIVKEQATMPGGAPKAQAIFAVIQDCFDSVITEGQMIKKIRIITGESTEKAAPAPKAAKATE